MHVTIGQVIGTAVATGVIGFVVWAVTVPLRWRSVTGLIASVVVTGPLAVLGGIGWALLLSRHGVAGPVSALVLALVAVLVAALESGVAATRAYRRFRRANRDLRASLGEFASGGFTADPPVRIGVDPTGDPVAAGSPAPVSTRRPLLAELETVRTELDEVARAVAAARARDQALDESRRQLIAWVSQDLHAPLSVLRAMAESAAETSAATSTETSAATSTGTSTGPPADGAATTSTTNAENAAAADIRDEVDRLLSAVDDLFDLATAPPGRGARSLVVPRWEPALLSAVLGDAVGAIEPLARLRGVSIHVLGSTTMQVRMLGPAGEDLSRQLLSVMVDAVRHSRPGTTVQIMVGPDPMDRSAVRIDLQPGTVATAAASTTFAGTTVGGTTVGGTTPDGLGTGSDGAPAAPGSGEDVPAGRLALVLPLCVPA